MSTVADMRISTQATPGGVVADALQHRPVLLHPLIESLQPRPGQIAVDGTLGAGGVTAALAERVVPGGRVIAIDRDASAVRAAQTRFAGATGTVIPVHGDFADMDTIVQSLGYAQVDMVALDLGISSLQLDDAARGFSFRNDGPLDMRIDSSGGVSATGIVNSWSHADLTGVIRDYGDERFARSIAAAIVRSRERGPITTTTQLRTLIEDSVPRRFWPKRIHPATRTFQALRIVVNHELESLERGLQATINILRPGGRLGVISFHSLEDTLVKNALHVAAQNCVCPPQQPHCTCAHRATLFILTRKVIRPDATELSANPRDLSRLSTSNHASHPWRSGPCPQTSSLPGASATASTTSIDSRATTAAAACGCVAAVRAHPCRCCR
jgi:16S rRNA (cytosine1402-N4)-methyltransferase